MGIKKPDKEIIDTQIEKIEIADKKLDSIRNFKIVAKNMVEKGYEGLQAPVIETRLKRMDVSELNTVSKGLHSWPLVDSGYYTIWDLMNVNKSRLLSINGIGDKTADLVLGAREKICSRVKKNTIVKIPEDENNKASSKIIWGLSWIVYEADLSEKAAKMKSEFSNKVSIVIDKLYDRPSFVSWLFMPKQKKVEYISYVKELELIENEYTAKVKDLTDTFEERKKFWEYNAWDNYFNNKEAYLHLLAQIVDVDLSVYDSISLNFESHLNKSKVNINRSISDNIAIDDSFKRNNHVSKALDKVRYSVKYEEYAEIIKPANATSEEHFAVIDVETTWQDDVMSIGIIIADSVTKEPILGKYYILTPEYKAGGMFSDVLKIPALKEMNISSRKNAMSEIMQLLDDNNVTRILAYNASFDKSRLPELEQYKWCDIMRLAAYKQFNSKIPESADCYGTGRLKRGYGVEDIIRMLTGNSNYTEVHNAYCDAIDELKIVKLLDKDISEYDIGGL